MPDLNLHDLAAGTLMEVVNSLDANRNGKQGPVVEVNASTGVILVDLPPPYGRTAMDMHRWTKVLTVNEDSEMGCALTDVRVGEQVRAEGCQDRMMNGEVGTIMALDMNNNCLGVAFDLPLGTKNLPTLKAQKPPLWQTLGTSGEEYKEPSGN